MKRPDEVKRELVTQWLARAQQDLGVAEHLLSQRSFLCAVGFHAQQAAEKYLKAFLVKHQIEFPKTHNIGLLLDLVTTVSADLSRSLQDIAVLSDYGVDVRYPGDLPDPTLEEAGDAVKLASKARDRILRALAGDA
jgi:HEPN domain-containing protein